MGVKFSELDCPDCPYRVRVKWKKVKEIYVVHLTNGFHSVRFTKLSPNFSLSAQLIPRNADGTEIR